ncbi:uncharacterized protein MYCFIDRAFT_172028 [Pseudocercospora fijiensis CIRAD86]|uniref:Uncharacterized protein n=1 Tax=Pseudocercospora fijiensis (strain CIRAD86) TaxID=383855 RepID=M2Z909_PSEFD|nr:uncharacterized protein MYCFIDRAFT_172028 [Pseudocercospora fijiensis CIRAD86]EME86250.1 hypothetical protein MYCFIDRAFT_172028 [Pseudocercospora fijiensis CIRAD86]
MRLQRTTPLLRLNPRPNRTASQFEGRCRFVWGHTEFSIRSEITTAFVKGIGRARSLKSLVSAKYLISPAMPCHAIMDVIGQCSTVQGRVGSYGTHMQVYESLPWPFQVDWPNFATTLTTRSTDTLPGAGLRRESGMSSRTKQRLHIKTSNLQGVPIQLDSRALEDVISRVESVEWRMKRLHTGDSGSSAGLKQTEMMQIQLYQMRSAHGAQAGADLLSALREGMGRTMGMGMGMAVHRRLRDRPTEDSAMRHAGARDQINCTQREREQRSSMEMQMQVQEHGPGDLHSALHSTAPQASRSR